MKKNIFEDYKEYKEATELRLVKILGNQRELVNYGRAVMDKMTGPFAQVDCTGMSYQKYLQQGVYVGFIKANEDGKLSLMEFTDSEQFIDQYCMMRAADEIAAILKRDVSVSFDDEFSVVKLH